MSLALGRTLKALLVAQEGARHALGQASPPGGAAFLIYHRVAGTLALELDIGPALFRRQMAWLAATRQVIAYDEAVTRLRNGSDEPGVVLTFDDGYRDFYTEVFPVLREYALPATLFVTTGFVEDGTPYPMMSVRGVEVAPVTWEMLGEMAESGLVTLGAHTHTHPVLAGQAPGRVAEELERPLELFQRRLGLRPRHFAYPKAIWDGAAEAAVARCYATAVIGGGAAATPARFNAYRIPRVPVRRSDGWWFFRAKLNGWLAGEEPMYERLRRARRRVG